MSRKHVRLTEKQFKKALRQLVKLLMKAIQMAQPISLSHLPESVPTTRGRNLSSAGDGLRCLNRILVEQQGVLIPLGKGRYAWANRKKLGKTIKESVDNLYEWVRNYRTTPYNNDNVVLTEAKPVQEPVHIVEDNHVLIMPNERAVLRQLLRTQIDKTDPITQLAVEKLLDVLDENKIARKQKLLN